MKYKLVYTLGDNTWYYGGINYSKRKVLWARLIEMAQEFHSRENAKIAMKEALRLHPELFPSAFDIIENQAELDVVEAYDRAMRGIS
jgi:hypothetical protein